LKWICAPEKNKISNSGKALSSSHSGLPDGLFSNQNHNLGKIWRFLQWKKLLHFMTIWSILQPFGIGILWPFGIFYGHLVYFFPF
jgi:hypothetical protein